MHCFIGHFLANITSSFVAIQKLFCSTGAPYMFTYNRYGSKYLTWRWSGNCSCGSRL